MRRNDRGAVLRRWVIVVAAGAFAVAAVMVAAPGSDARRNGVPTSGFSDAKTRAEIAQLQTQTRKLNSDRSFLWQNGAVLAGMLTALVAAVNLLVTLYKQIAEQARQRGCGSGAAGERECAARTRAEARAGGA